MADGYKVLVDELTVHKAVRKLQHPITGEDTGWQQGAGATWFLDEIIPESEMNPEWAEALTSGEGPLAEALSGKLEVSSDEPALNEAYRLGLPFEGYDDMDEDDILAAMRVLPSPAVMRMKDWERKNEAREAIVNYNIGFGEAPDDRNSGRIAFEEDAELDEDKPVRRMRTRELNPETGEFQFGEGITGSGDPPVAPGTTASQEDSDEVEEPVTPPEGEAGDSKLKPAARTGRRARATKKPPTPTEPQDVSPGGSQTKPGDSPSHDAP